jgi:hypothetical protein
VALHGPVGASAHSSTVPVPQPMPEILPVVLGQTLLVIVMLGSVGLVQVPGTVAVAALIGLAVVPSKSHKHRVSIFWEGPF